MRSKSYVFAEWLDRSLADYGKTMLELAKEARCSSSYIGKIVRRFKPDPSYEIAIRIGRALGKEDDVRGLYRNRLGEAHNSVLERQERVVKGILRDNDLPESRTRRVLWKFGRLVEDLGSYTVNPQKNIDLASLREEAFEKSAYYLAHLEILENRGDIDPSFCAELRESFLSELDEAMKYDLKGYLLRSMAT